MDCFAVYVDEELIFSVTPPVEAVVGLALVVLGDGSQGFPFNIGINYEDENGEEQSIRWRSGNLPLKTKLRVGYEDRAERIWPQTTVAENEPFRPNAYQGKSLKAHVQAKGLEEKEFYLDGAALSHFLVSMKTESRERLGSSEGVAVSLLGRDTSDADMRRLIDMDLEKGESVWIAIDGE